MRRSLGTGVLALCLLSLLSTKLPGPIVLNRAAVYVSHATVVLAHSSDGDLDDVSGHELEHARDLLLESRTTPPGGTTLLALIAYLTDPSDTRLTTLEDVARVSMGGHPIAKLWLGEAYLQNGDWQKALTVWADIGARRQLFEMGDMFGAKERWAEAALAYEASLPRSGGNVQQYLKLGAVLERLGRSEEALRVYERLLEIDARNYGGYLGIGNIYRDREMFDEAQAWYDRAVRETGEREWPYIASARVYEMQGDLERAESRLRIVIRENPENCQAWAQMGGVLGKQELFSEALAGIEEAVRLCPETLWLYQALSHARQAAGDVEGARQAQDIYLQLLENEGVQQ